MTSGQNIEALLEVFDEPLRDPSGRTPTAAKPALSAPGQDLARPPSKGIGPAQSPAAKPAVAPATPRKGGASVKGLISALIGIALVPMAILFALLWQDMMRLRGTETVAPAKQMSAVRTFDQSASTEPKQAARLFEVALSSPGRIDAEAGDVVEFPIAIDATAALPARSIVAITALPEGASFSAGRPFGVSGWSLRPDEIGDLQLRLPPRTADSGAGLWRTGESPTPRMPGQGPAGDRPDHHPGPARSIRSERVIDDVEPASVSLPAHHLGAGVGHSHGFSVRAGALEPPRRAQQRNVAMLDDVRRLQLDPAVQREKSLECGVDGSGAADRLAAGTVV